MASNPRKRSLSQDYNGGQQDTEDAPAKRFLKHSLNDNVTQLRLEAIFHPKFENESSDKQIRSAMLNRVSKKEGYIEVSLKHSGSLLLWSGSQRFFSKNSTNNVFTHVGEILLYQHFVRAFGCDQDTDGLDRKSYIHKRFQDCSSFLEHNRLTLSFELVTNVLGHHGDIPKRNYLILIAVADRSKQKFYSTVELIQFAHKFRLAHNDIWIFDTSESCSSVFDFYDKEWEDIVTTRATEFLDSTSSILVKSLYPHLEFQGEILEGLVMRYVSYDEDDDSSHDALTVKREQFLKDMTSLSNTSMRMLEIVPPKRTVDSTLGDEVDSIDEPGLSILYKVKFEDHSNQHDFAQNLNDSLHQAYGVNRRRITYISKDTLHAFDMIHISRYLLSSPYSTEETKYISLLIQTLNEINVKVSYNITQEHTKSKQGDDIVRYICTIHVKKDEAFQKYSKVTQGRGVMKLFRGCTIEIIVDPTHHSNASMLASNDSNNASDQIPVESTETSVKNDAQPLMLKMKFLPYMARTFICRNGLSILSQTGAAAFEEFAYKQLSKWNVVQSKRDYWMNFFRGWAKYCSSPPKKSSTGTSIAPLTKDTYLHHIDEFRSQYNEGRYNIHPPSNEASFRGLIVIVGATILGLNRVAMALMKILGCSQAIKFDKTINDNSILPHVSGGLICYTSACEGLKFFRNMVNNERICKDDFFLVLVGLSISDINSAYPSPTDNLAKKTKGCANGWNNCRRKLLLHLPLSILSYDDKELYSSLNNSASDIGGQIHSLRNLSKESQNIIKQPGILAFFPLIPGAGKSFLCQELSNHLLKGGCDKQIYLMEGDKTSGKFFAKLRGNIRSHPASVFVADKNIPNQSFSAISDLCSEFNLTAIAVLPNGMKDTLIRTRNCTVVFPFSLEFLSVCLSRVMMRDPASHPGNLDKENGYMCMIVIKFYCLYRGITVRKFLYQVHSLGKAMNTIIELPFFSTQKSPLPQMPKDLRTTLTSAISLSLKNPSDFSSKCAKDDSFKDMEDRLRKCIENHLSYIDGIVVDKETSKSLFVSKLSNAVKSLGDTFVPRDISDARIKIVSLDIKKNHVDEILQSLVQKDPRVASFYETAKKKGKFINNTHCTFCHKSNTSSGTMRSLYNHLIGKSVEISITDLYISNEVAAFAISALSEDNGYENEFMTKGDNPELVPKPFNTFPHITIWCDEGVRSHTSNMLPLEVKKDNAIKIKLDPNVTVCGKLKYWYEN